MTQPIDLKSAAHLTNVPEKLLWKMHREGIIGNPIEDRDLRGVAMISDIWRKEWFLRMALADYSQARRMELIQKPELTRVERYVLKCYLNAKEGERIQTRDIIGRVDITSRHASPKNRCSGFAPWPTKFAGVDGWILRRENNYVWKTDRKSLEKRQLIKVVIVFGSFKSSFRILDRNFNLLGLFYFLAGHITDVILSGDYRWTLSPSFVGCLGAEEECGLWEVDQWTDSALSTC